jgi:hypothetical protein
MRFLILARKKYEIIKLYSYLSLMTEIKQGGKREGAGRKPLPLSQKKIVLNLYPTNADLYKFGNKKKMCEEILKFISGYGEQTNIQDLNKATNEIKPFKQPETNYQLNVPRETIRPQTVSKSFEQYKQAKRECELPEQWDELEAEIDADPFLSQKQKHLLKTVL